jgi:hypothetical protein
MFLEKTSNKNQIKGTNTNQSNQIETDLKNKSKLYERIRV